MSHVVLVRMRDVIDAVATVVKHRRRQRRGDALITECRMIAIASEQCFADLSTRRPAFNDRTTTQNHREEPSVLPSTAFPTLLVNGPTGIGPSAAATHPRRII